MATGAINTAVAVFEINIPSIARAISGAFELSD